MSTPFSKKLYSSAPESEAKSGTENAACPAYRPAPAYSVRSGSDPRALTEKDLLTEKWEHEIIRLNSDSKNIEKKHDC